MDLWPEKYEVPAAVFAAEGSGVMVSAACTAVAARRADSSAGGGLARADSGSADNAVGPCSEDAEDAGRAIEDDDDDAVKSSGMCRAECCRAISASANVGSAEVGTASPIGESSSVLALPLPLALALTLVIPPMFFALPPPLFLALFFALPVPPPPPPPPPLPPPITLPRSTLDSMASNESRPLDMRTRR